ncbi:MAG: 30S ribosomal protein S2 [Candidatus Aegiribacteria sp.]|nr:30S ribosomal protein S2 [Candidatus Aegiribacteria sp.]
MTIPSMKEMLEAGIHFGHQKSRWNPKMKNYIFMARNGIHIIDLKKSRVLLEDAANLVAKTVASGKSVLFVATKKQGRECLKEHAIRCGQYYVTERWMGGMLTNFSTISKGIQTLIELEKAEKEGYPTGLTKKEILRKKRHREKLERDLTGIRHMKKLPGVVIIVDIKKEQIAVREARNLKIPCIGIVDTNCDPTEVDYPVPGNDDAIKSISMIVGTLADYALLGAEGVTSADADAKALEEMVKEPKPEKPKEAASEKESDDAGKEDKGTAKTVKPAKKKTTSKASETSRKKSVSSKSVEKTAEKKTTKKTTDKKAAENTASDSPAEIADSSEDGKESGE